jgi:pimeloyl-ACP methyl ester carboxylesterase
VRDTFLSRLTDRLILCPTRHAIPTEDKRRRVFAWVSDEVEVWTHRAGGDWDREPDLFVLKFPGTGGRAECSTDQPADCWPDCCAELWTVNPPGYGGSTGRASLRKAAPVARLVGEELARVAAGRPLLVTGNSLGCTTALYLAATMPVAGLILRNPPPLREVILGRHSWWNLGLGVRWLVRHLPQELDCDRNARRATVPAVFVASGRDTVVPPRYQRPVYEAYAGPKRLLVLPDADHATPMTAVELAEYHALLAWLRQQSGF